METIDRVVYINLDHRNDRKKHTEEELNRIGITNYVRFSAIYTPKNALGCALSHYHVVKQAEIDKVSSLLVLEDDFDVLVDADTLNNRISSFIKEYSDYDVLMLDYRLIDYEQVTDGVIRVREARTATAYLIAGHYIPTLAKCYEETCSSLSNQPWCHWLYTNDIAWNVLQRKDKWYCLVPRMVYQHGGYSDLGQCFIEKHTY